MDATKVCFHRVTWTLVCLIFVLSDNVLGQEKVTFEDHIKPMFRTRCAACHNPDKKNGDLDVTNYTSLMLGGVLVRSFPPGMWVAAISLHWSIMMMNPPCRRIRLAFQMRRLAF